VSSSSPGSRLLVVQNDSDKALGRLGDALIGAGVELDLRSSARELPAVGGYDGLIVLPGLADPVDQTDAVQRARGAIGDALAADLAASSSAIAARPASIAATRSLRRMAAAINFMLGIARSAPPVVGAWTLYLGLESGR